jgi:hypothetical protein
MKNDDISGIIIFINVCITALMYTFVRMWYASTYTYDYFITNFINGVISLYIILIIFVIIVLISGRR